MSVSCRWRSVGLIVVFDSDWERAVLRDLIGLYRSTHTARHRACFFDHKVDRVFSAASVGNMYESHVVDEARDSPDNQRVSALPRNGAGQVDLVRV